MAGTERKDDERKGPHGEGNYDATRQYNEGLKDHVQHHDIEREARDAEPKSEEEAREMEAAEREGRNRSRGEDGSPPGKGSGKG